MRQCKGTTRKGQACKAPPLKAGDYCLAHDLKAREKARFSGAVPGAGRPPLPRAVDIIRERIERNVDQVIAPLFAALEASGGYALKIDGETEFIETPDHTTRLAAVRELLDRGYGKPKQATEVTGAGGEPLVPPSLPTDCDWRTDVVAALREMTPSATTDLGANGSANGSRNGHSS